MEFEQIVSALEFKLQPRVIVISVLACSNLTFLNFGVIRDHSWSFWGHLESFKIIWRYLGSFKVILNYSG